ncbi:MAG: pyridoxal phosphate-dependent aminotransferase [Clostridia bacterium]|nr:pyridoxal phosphate-dependent aminotransferase [Clostridia bacterium]MBR3576885.1 pyridoxal phosphate-dependent aminotransferase [Clostridia bacterium]
MFISKKASRVNPSTTLYIDSKFKALKASGVDAVGFGTGEPDFDTPQHIKDAAIKALEDGMTKYTPASGLPALKQAVCNKLKRDNGLDYEISNIVVSNGAKHSLMNIFTAICDPGDEIIIPTPFWVSYPEMVSMADGVPVFVETTADDGFKVTVDKLDSVLTNRTRAIIINSPSNPTGMVYDKDELLAIAKWAVAHDLYIISDEVYEHLVYDGAQHVSLATFSEEIKEHTIIVNAVSKTYAMTGWRIGYTASNAELAKVMSNIQSHGTSNPNTIAQYAAITALDGSLDAVYEMRTEFIKRRNYMVEKINEIDGVSCLMPKGAFYVMMNMEELVGKKLYGKEIKNSDDFAELFLEKALVAVVPCTGFGAPNYVRWSYATSMESIEKGLDRLKKFLAEGLE